MATLRKPPAPLEGPLETKGVFLAGSIEMGQAKDWQEQVYLALQETDIWLLNPRREEWDASWEQSITNPIFREQVEWELDALARCAMIAMYFVPGTQSPISLLELGLFARSQKLVVCCPDGYWRKGNVDVVCARYGIPQVPSLEALIASIKEEMGA